MSIRPLRVLLPCSLLMLLITGCSLPMERATVPAPVDAPLVAHGHVHGGQQPVAGSSIQIYAVGVTGDYSAATPLLATPAMTDVNGNFNITGTYSCGSATQVYITATGGIPGGYAANANLALMAALGPCAAAASAVVNIDELTTVSAVAALHLFMSGPTNIGSSAYDSSALQQDFALAGELVNTPLGTAPGVGVPSGFTVPASLINTLGDILAACINSGGIADGSGSRCSALFTLATPPGGTAPTDTITALLDILNHPTLNTTSLYALITPDAPFQPALTGAPTRCSSRRRRLPLPDSSWSSPMTALLRCTT